MRRFISVACVIALAAAPALAGDGQVSKQSLSRMGLSGMKVVPDREGLQVRGQSIAITFSASSGTTILSINSPFSVGNHFAFSASVGVSGHAIAGGFASASAH
jgi:hypothetical protein